MTFVVTPPPVGPAEPGADGRPSLLERYDLAQKAGGVVAPVLTALLAFLVVGGPGLLSIDALVVRRLDRSVTAPAPGEQNLWLRLP